MNCTYIALDTFDARRCQTCHEQACCDAYSLYLEDLAFAGRNEFALDEFEDVEELAVMA